MRGWTSMPLPAAGGTGDPWPLWACMPLHHSSPSTHRLLFASCVFFSFIIRTPATGHKTHLKSKRSAPQDTYLYLKRPYFQWGYILRFQDGVNSRGTVLNPLQMLTAERDFTFTYLPHLTKLKCSDMPLPWTQTHFWGPFSDPLCFACSLTPV